MAWREKRARSALFRAELRSDAQAAQTPRHEPKNQDILDLLSDKIANGGCRITWCSSKGPLSPRQTSC